MRAFPKRAPTFLPLLLTLSAGFAAAGAPAAMRAPLRGVTIDDVEGLPKILEALGKLSRKPTARIVFDASEPASHYAAAAKAIHEKAYVMGELVDSEDVKNVSLKNYKARAAEYVAELGASVDIWEVGNELNGEWLGAKAADKAAAAFDLVKSRGGVAALTLIYNEECADDPRHKIFRWTRALPERMRRGLDYVFVSYYEDDCDGQRPDWPRVFRRLSAEFPNSRLGIGEFGTENENKKEEFIRRYYTMRLSIPRFVGGYFWWYFKEDMVPASRPLWKVLDRAISERKSAAVSGTP